jgi:hypothetical protein
LHRQAVREAEFLGLPIDPRALVPDGTASELERIFLRLCRREKPVAALVRRRLALAARRLVVARRR